MWAPLLLGGPLLVIAIAALLFDAGLGATRASFPATCATSGQVLRLRLLTAALYLVQPLARLQGRLAEGLTPWRRRGQVRLTLPAPRQTWFWSERWASGEQRVRDTEAMLRDESAVVISGGDWDRWDLAVRAGGLGSVRLRLATEEHGSGRQLVRIRWWPRISPAAVAIVTVLVAVTAAASATGAGAVAATAGILTALVILRCAYECAVASSTMSGAMHRQPRATDEAPLAVSGPAAAHTPAGS